MAWRDTADFALSWVIEPGPPDERRAINRRRVSSPSAANNGAASRTGGPLATLTLDIAADVLDLPTPPAVVHAERLGATRRRDFIES